MTHTAVWNRFEERARAVALIAARFAGDVDSVGRFPAETFEALKQQRLLGIQIPLSMGGEGATLAELAEICRVLGMACASSAMIYAMHNIQLACLVAFHREMPWHVAFIQRIAQEQLLLASSTTEAEIGGDLRRSRCAAEEDGELIWVEKNAPVVSYGAEADAILLSCRRGPLSAAQDQILIVFARRDYNLTQTTSWDALGMRGTCSNGYIIAARGHVAQVIPATFAEIVAGSMQMVSHILWSSTWFGIACEATAKARAFLVDVARRKGEPVPIGVAHLVEMQIRLQSTKSVIESALIQYSCRHQRPGDGGPLAFASVANNVKVIASENLISIVNDAFSAIGLAAYSNSSRFSLSRLLRDAYSSVLMISNDRIRMNNGSMALLSPAPLSFHSDGRSRDELSPQLRQV